MACAETLRTQSYIDGEATGAAAAAAEAHIAGCAECQAFCADAAALSDAIRRHAPRHAAPPALRRRVAAMLDQAARPAVGAGWRARPDFWRGAASGAGLATLAAGLVLFTLLPPSAASLADQVTAAHTRALMSGREIAVVSSDHHTVKPWFAGRLALSPPVADFAAKGYALAGGRLDRVAAEPAAVVVYRRGRHVIDLFVWADRGGPLPAAGLSRGYHSIFWRKGDLDFAAVSDAAAPELAEFVALVRAEPE
jgi:anti-sigma factor RsiW